MTNTDDPRKAPAVTSDRSPAEGERPNPSTEDRGKNPNIDPAARVEPAEGGRDEVEPTSTPAR